jgi:glucose/arabinose dehydrogenase
MRLLLLAALLSAGCARTVPNAPAEWPRIALEPRYGDLVNPLYVVHAGDGSGAVYIVEQAGRIRTARDGKLRDAPFLDITDRVQAGGERGLLGVAFPPNYAGKRRFYVNYTRRPDGNTVIARYRVAADSGSADPASEEVLLVIKQPFANHNGGQIAFGPDGFLYIGTGDGGSGGDPLNNGQSTATLLGKLLRIDVESESAPYAIPRGNPFARRDGFREEIWAYGLRNPWRFSFDRLTGDLYVADVGQDAREEVNVRPATSGGGENYGWNIMEGSRCFRESDCDRTGLVFPVTEYDHSQGCSVTGGYVYRGKADPRMQGVYFYGDYCSGKIWGLRHEGKKWRNALLLESPHAISSFGEDEAGNLYVTDHRRGTVLELVPREQGRLTIPRKGMRVPRDSNLARRIRPGDGFRGNITPRSASGRVAFQDVSGRMSAAGRENRGVELPAEAGDQGEELFRRKVPPLDLERVHPGRDPVGDLLLDRVGRPVHGKRRAGEKAPSSPLGGGGRPGHRKPRAFRGRSGFPDVARQPALPLEDELGPAAQEHLHPQAGGRLDGGDFLAGHRRRQHDRACPQIAVEKRLGRVERGNSHRRAEGQARELPGRQKDHAGVGKDHRPDPVVAVPAEGGEEIGELSRPGDDVERDVQRGSAARGFPGGPGDLPGGEPRPRPPAAPAPGAHVDGVRTGVDRRRHRGPAPGGGEQFRASGSGGGFHS